VSYSQSTIPAPRQATSLRVLAAVACVAVIVAAIAVTVLAVRLISMTGDAKRAVDEAGSGQGRPRGATIASVSRAPADASGARRDAVRASWEPPRFPWTHWNGTQTFQVQLIDLDGNGVAPAGGGDGAQFEVGRRRASVPVAA
jgi:hypothetical protein